ncbi:hypothetical protein [Sinorhizobium meliloti]|uniref:hypothetical protein n=1 Tax=Rhizobium meliloti TaxID=382 RepID=UPI000A5F67D7|nr:hypothetical protein [Sinorhizobium meliloti]MDE3828920.1 hypothetical protein [Sinorhizobium meliloti]MDE3854993.1 hypothetical protein [Sinorhizobium meliloti]MDW9393719.1 hypothetical protein [Sinorhizobium meliloti]MDW9430959.1 hypothetical protein [Sinorhizobium meliloti]MDW9438710.1 hypothetical protein [Sinorhizobium meliloti]
MADNNYMAINPACSPQQDALSQAAINQIVLTGTPMSAANSRIRNGRTRKGPIAGRDKFLRFLISRPLETWPFGNYVNGKDSVTLLRN